MKTFVKYICLLAIFVSMTGTASAEELRERVYLHTDKQVYLAGELLWMKMYVTGTDGKPLPFSKVGYVELLEGDIAQEQVKLDIDNATGEGWIEIPSTLPTGHYRLAAYTRNMKNEGEGVFFYKTIGIINTFRPDPSVELDTLIQAQEASLLENTISVVTEKDSYSRRSQGTIRLNSLPDNIHSLSISIAGKDLASPYNETNITKWNKSLSQTSLPPFNESYTPEYEGHIIRGQIRDIRTDEIAKDKDIYPQAGFIGDQIRVFGGQVKDKGEVEFYTSRIKGMYELATTSHTALKNQYRINIESPFSEHKPASLPPFRMNPMWEKQLTERNFGLQVLHAFLADSLSRVDTTYAHFRWTPDRSYILDEYTRFTRMDEIIIEFIPSLRFRKYNDKRTLNVLDEDASTFSLGNSLVLLDGIPIIDHELIFKYDPLLVYRIDVYKNRFVFSGQYFNGLVMLTTYNKDYPSLVLDDNTQIFDYEGTQAHRRFYVPSYTNKAEKDSRIPDYRHTLLWNPEVETEGKTSLSLPFYTSDITGDFHIVIEGVTKDGKAVRGTAGFSVE